MKKLFSLIIGITLLTSLLPVGVLAAGQSEAEKSCAEKRPDFTKLMDEWFPKDKLNDLKSNQDILTNSYFQGKLEEAQEAYHSYVECIIQFAQDRVWAVAEGSGSSTAPTLSNIGSPDWNKPDEACLSPEELKKVYGQDTSANALVPPLLEAYQEYKDTLEQIVSFYDFFGVSIKGQNIDALSVSVSSVNALKRQVNTEVESSLVAMNTALSALQELRISFVMHVHFQCMIANLTKYRKLLEAIRTAVLDLPSRLEDASIHK